MLPMLARMQVLNQHRQEAGSVLLRFGIGLHQGDVLDGNIGTRSRIEFTVVGAAVNEAARIHALCNQLPGVGKAIELFTLEKVS